MRKRDKKIKGLSELIKYLKQDLRGYDGPVWFRGHANVNWSLIPGHYRVRNISEMTLIKKFKQNANLLLEHTPLKSFDWLFLMQHHGVPTRLLDWTESPLTGSYFSCIEKPNQDGALWILLPVELNKFASINSDEEFYVPSFEEENYLGNYSPETFNRETTSVMLPMAALATRNSPRMQSQLGVFTISHRDQISIDKIGNCQHIWRYIIPRASKKNILKELELCGISEFQLFPELSSIGKIIKNNL